MKPGWLLHKEARRREEREREIDRGRLLFRIQDVCCDIDVWLDLPSGETWAGVLEQLGESPTLAALQTRYARLLRQASLRGDVRGLLADLEEEVAA